MIGPRDELAAYVVLGGRATTAKASELFSLAAQMLRGTALDNQRRAIEMLKQSVSRYETSVISSGNAFASSSLSARFHLAGHVDETLSGIPQLATLRAALEQAQTDWPSLLGRLERMRAALLSVDGALPPRGTPITH